MKDISKLALAGLIGGSLVLTQTSCGGSDDSSAKEAAETAGDYVDGPHACAGKNTCKGLGGCGVTEEKLASLAKKAGVDIADAGSAHECAGKNACKGLGGCEVTAAKLASLKAAANK